MSDAVRCVSGPPGWSTAPRMLPRLLLELGEVVVLRAHQPAQRDVGPARLLGGRRTLVAQPLDLALQREHRLERLGRHGLADAERRDAERLEGLPAHRPLEGDLQRRALVERLGLEQRVERGAQGPRDRLQQRELRLAPAVLDHRELAGRAVDGAGELVERHAALGAQLPDAAADGEGIHLFIVVQVCADARGIGDVVMRRFCHESRTSPKLHTRIRPGCGPELHPEWTHDHRRLRRLSRARGRGIRHRRPT